MVIQVRLNSGSYLIDSLLRIHVGDSSDILL